MKNWIKKIGQNKFQFFFFVGIVCLLFVAIIVGSINTNKPVESPGDDTTVTPTPTPDDEENVEKTGAYFIIPSNTKLLYVYRLKVSDIEKEINEKNKNI